MNWVKLAPYAGWPLALILFFAWLDGRENLAQQVELCNQQKLESVAAAERSTRQALSAAHERRLSELEALVLQESKARRIAEMGRRDAEAASTDAQNTIRRLVAEARGAENATIEQVCLDTAVPAVLVDSLRQ